jgi:hypothetical protein
MDLRLVRDICGEACTLGQLRVDGVFECFTLEDVARPDGEKIHGRTAIPEGRYQIIVNRSPRFRRDLPLLLNVPNFEGVRIHPGNTHEDTEGCILPGRRRTQTSVLESRPAFDALLAKISAAIGAGERIWIEIESL